MNAKRSRLKWWILGSFVSLPAFLLAVTLGYQVVTGQPIGANTLLLTDAASGSAPAVRANGQDANISINIVPKGTGTVQINGVPVAVSGGTVTSLTVNPGPLAVTGTTNLTGPLFIQPGTNGTLKGVAARIFHVTTDAPTTGTVAETLYTFNLPANTLAVDGQAIRIIFSFITAANGNNKNALISFGATNIWSTGQGAFNNNLDTVVCDVFRTGAATQKSVCNLVHFTNAAVSALGGANTVIGGNGNAALTTPGETLSGAVAILFRALTPTAAADLTAKFAAVDWIPQGQ